MPSKPSAPTPKVTAAAVGGSAATVLIYALSLAGVTVPGEVGAAIGTLAAFGAGYLKAP
jgi:hypothetical protein